MVKGTVKIAMKLDKSPGTYLLEATPHSQLIEDHGLHEVLAA